MESKEQEYVEDFYGKKGIKYNKTINYKLQIGVEQNRDKNKFKNLSSEEQLDYICSKLDFILNIVERDE